MPILSSFRLLRQAVILLFLLGISGPAAVRASNHEGLQLFIDPSQRAVTLHIPAEAPRSGLQLSMLDATGHIVYHKPLNTTSGPLVSMPISEFHAGIYLLIVEGPNGYNVAQRLVIK